MKGGNSGDRNKYAPSVFPLSLVRYLLPLLAWFVSCDWLSSYAVAGQELPYLSILQN